jgi:DNA-binding NarL/FixJ family response regulator
MSAERPFRVCGEEEAVTTDVRVLIVEDDLYARDMMATLITRDWRTRVAGEAGNETEMQQVLEAKDVRVDMILLDTEVPGDPEWPFHLARIAQQRENPPLIVCTGTQSNLKILAYALQREFCGYIVKSEIRYALAWAVVRAKEGRWVITPGIRTIAAREGISLHPETLVMRGRNPASTFTPREQQIARLAVLFNMRRKDVADELMLSYHHVRGLVTQVYEKLELSDILAGETDPAVFFPGQRKVLERFQKATANESKGKRAGSIEAATLVFHLLTVPHEEELS